jgi:hypothetical protein
VTENRTRTGKANRIAQQVAQVCRFRRFGNRQFFATDRQTCAPAGWIFTVACQTPIISVSDINDLAQSTITLPLKP